MIKRSKKPRPVPIGRLTEAQTEAINAVRAERGFTLLSGEVFFIGTHLYKSRITEDGYSEEEVLEMIYAAMSPDCTFVRTPKIPFCKARDYAKAAMDA